MNPYQSKVHFDLHLYEVFAKGYLSAAGSTMHTAEKKSLAWGAKLMTLECGIRFLTDYLEGDHYFRIARPNHNLGKFSRETTKQFSRIKQSTELLCFVKSHLDQRSVSGQTIRQSSDRIRLPSVVPA